MQEKLDSIIGEMNGMLESLQRLQQIQSQAENEGMLLVDDQDVVHGREVAIKGEIKRFREYLNEQTGSALKNSWFISHISKNVERLFGKDSNDAIKAAAAIVEEISSLKTRLDINSNLVEQLQSGFKDLEVEEAIKEEYKILALQEVYNLLNSDIDTEAFQQKAEAIIERRKIDAFIENLANPGKEYPEEQLEHPENLSEIDRDILFQRDAANELSKQFKSKEGATLSEVQAAYQKIKHPEFENEITKLVEKYHISDNELDPNQKAVLPENPAMRERFAVIEAIKTIRANGYPTHIMAADGKPAEPMKVIDLEMQKVSGNQQIAKQMMAKDFYAQLSISGDAPEAPPSHPQGKVKDSQLIKYYSDKIHWEINQALQNKNIPFEDFRYISIRKISELEQELAQKLTSSSLVQFHNKLRACTNVFSQSITHHQQQNAAPPIATEINNSDDYMVASLLREHSDLSKYLAKIGPKDKKAHAINRVIQEIGMQIHHIEFYGVPKESNPEIVKLLETDLKERRHSKLDAISGRAESTSYSLTRHLRDVMDSIRKEDPDNQPRVDSTPSA